METKFQTSFIPKKPIPTVQTSFTPTTPRRTVNSTTGSMFMTLAIVLFVVSVLAIGGAYAYNKYLDSQHISLQEQLNNRIREFNLDQISLIKAQSAKIALSRQILNNHLAMSYIFEAIGKITAESTRFLTLGFDLPISTQGAPGIMNVALSGYSRSFPSLAFQSDVLNQLENYQFQNVQLRSVIRNPIIKDPSVTTNGIVNFELSAQIDPGAFSYVKILEEQSKQ